MSRSIVVVRGNRNACKWGRGYGSVACWEAPALPPIPGQTDADAPIVQPVAATQKVLAVLVGYGLKLES